MKGSSPPSPDEHFVEPTVLQSTLQALLFTDIVDSTGIKGRVGTSAYATCLRRHNQIIEEAIAGFAEAKIIKHTGDGYFAVFPTASVAVRCALRFQRALAREGWPGEPIRVRVGIHAGEVAMVRMVDRTDIVGSPADLAARIMSLGAGGQILVSRAAADEARQFIAGEKVRWTRHGAYNLKGVAVPVDVWEVADAQTTAMPPPAGSVEPSIGAAPVSAADGSVPKQIGPYRIVEKLGEGGMGTVYKAEQRSPVKRTVALKLVKAGMGTAEVLARFEAERQALARMNHPHIAKVLDAGADNLGRAYFVMEYVPGIRITKFADDNKLTIKQRLELFIQVCDAIAHAHTKAILHRDITAANVMAYMDDDKPTVKVIDFGIAKAITGDRLTDRTFNTDRGSVIGTYDAMSPEQAEGSSDIDTRTDVYSLGVLLYELLTGAQPFDHAKSTDEEIRRHIREVDPPKPSTRLSALDEAATSIASVRQVQIDSLALQLRSELEWIPLMAMRKERQRRYASPLELSADIENYLKGLPLRAAPDALGYRLRKFLYRNKGKVIASAAIVILLVGGIVSTSVGLAWALRERSAAEQARRSEMLAMNRAVLEFAAAQQSADEANHQFVEWLLSQASLAMLKGSGSDARQLLTKARSKLEDLHLPTARADLPLYTLFMNSPPELMTYSGHKSWVCAVAISADGLTALSASADKTLKLWEISTGRVLRTFEGHTDRVQSVAFSPDGRSMLSGSSDKTLKLWDIASGRELRTFSGHKDAIYCVRFRPDGHTVLSGSNDKTMKLWDVATGQELRTFSGHTDAVVAVAFSPDGQTILSGSNDNTMKLWNVADGRELRTYSGHTSWVRGVMFSPDGRSAISASNDNTIKLWNVETGAQIRTLTGHTAGVFAAAFSPDGNTALSAGDDLTVRLWDVATGRERQTFFGHSAWIDSVAFSPDGRTAISGSWDHTMKLWSLTDGLELRRLSQGGHQSGAGSNVAFGFAGRVALGADSQTTAVHLWDSATGRSLRTFGGRGTGGPNAMSHDGKAALTGGVSVSVWNIMSGLERLRLREGGWIKSVAFTPDDKEAVVSSMADDGFGLWELSSGSQIRHFAADQKFGSAVALRPDGQSALAAGTDGTLRLLEISSGRDLVSMETKVKGQTSVAISPDGHTALSGSDRVQLWDLSTGKELRAFSDGSNTFTTSVAFSPDGQLAASSSGKSLFLWELNSGALMAKLEADTDVWNVAFSPDGRALFAKETGGVTQWNIGRVGDYLQFSQSIPKASAALETNPDDAAALATLGEWYAFRGIDEWAAQYLEKARAGGADVSPLMLARTYWNLNDFAKAEQEFRSALKAAEAPADYLQLCLEAVAARNLKPDGETQDGKMTSQ